MDNVICEERIRARMQWIATLSIDFMLLNSIPRRHLVASRLLQPAFNADVTLGDAYA